MPGVNLSQSIAEKSAYQAKNGSDKGRLVVFVVFLLTLLVWGGVRTGMFWYEKKIVAMQREIEMKKAGFGGSIVSDIADVDARLALVNEKKSTQVYPKTVLTGLEGIILPANRLTGFEYDFKKNSVRVMGEAPGYKEVAQQVMAFKVSPLFSDTVVSNLSRMKGDENAPSVVVFDITAVWDKKN